MTQSSKSYQDKPTSKAWIVLFIGLIISTIFAVYLENKARIDGSELFHLRNERITSKIKQQFNIQSLFIQNTVARINSSEKLLDKTTFSEFIKDTQYQFFSLGVFSIGLNTYVTKNELRHFEAQIRKQNYPNYTVFPSGVRDTYTPVTFIEPLDNKNSNALGYDTYSNPIRREAQDRAIETGKITITKKISLVKNDKKEDNSVLIFAPVFKKGMPIGSIKARRKAIQGFVTSPFKIDSLIKVVLADEDLASKNGFTFTLYDSNNPDSRQILFSNSNSSNTQYSKYQQSRELKLDNNNIWYVEFFSNESTKFPNYSFAQETIIAVICGFSISLIAFLYILSSINLQSNSQSLANSLTKEINTLNQRLKLALESANMGVWDYDPVNNILIWDDKQFEIFGIDKNSFEGLYSAWVNAIHPEDRERASQESQAAIANKHDFNSEFRIIKNGEVHYLKGQAIVLLDSKGNVIRMIGVNYDVTEFKETLDSLEAEKKKADIANIAKSQFIARMSHEIRTPLNGIIGLTSLALRSPLSKEIQDYFDQIHFSSNSLLKILNEVLDFAKLESGKMNIEKVSFRLSNLIEESKNLFTPSATLKNNTLVFEIDPKIPNQLIGDESHIRQIIFNLLGNAIKFTSDGTITLKVKLNRILNKHADLHFSIEDSGIGINIEDFPKIIRPFEQADDSISRRFGGTGLGLSICQELLYLMNSNLQITSSEGKGSVFSFHLNLGIDSVNTSIEENRSSNTSLATNNDLLNLSHLQNKLVLVAEDNPINLEVISQMLKILKINFKSAVNGIECIEQINKGNFDLILMDIQMPILDGYATTQKIRAMEDFKNIPIIGVSAGISNDNHQLYFQRGINDTLNKPFTLEELHNVLVKWLK